MFQKYLLFEESSYFASSSQTKDKEHLFFNYTVCLCNSVQSALYWSFAAVNFVLLQLDS